MPTALLMLWAGLDVHKDKILDCPDFRLKGHDVDSE
jgi:hypothetical protein